MHWKPVVLAILDGWGLSDTPTANAPLLAQTPIMDRLMATRPTAKLVACGPAVGLPEGQMGNSEVGHITIGAGRVVWMDLPRIDRAIADGSFATNAALGDFSAKLKRDGGTAHLLGLASPGGVHSHQRHLIEAAKVLASEGLPVRLHLLTDGRDIAPKSAAAQVAEIIAAIDDLPDTKVATVTGRFYAMDRDNRWERVEKAWAAIAAARGQTAKDAAQAIKAAYARGETDEFVLPTVVGTPSPIGPNDGLLCTNFRADRAREILGALVDPGFAEFSRNGSVPLMTALGMVSYSGHLDQFIPSIFPAEAITNTLGAWIARAGLRQFRLAETEKYPHVTFFLNGGREVPFTGEDRRMAPSPKVATYDQAPEMAAEEVTEHLVAAIQDRYDLIVVNYANPDMVGHTGDLDAAIRACEIVDRGLGTVVAAIEEVGGAMLVVADHGNCETMLDAEGGPHTAHTLNPVPAVLVAPGVAEGTRLSDGTLSDIAPTLLQLMGIEQPDEMTGRSLIRAEIG
ncbi:MAG: 2,3-bisphosphoglycerate-independent phosphoglycerate mutase [Pseudomonadota bacterium]